MLKDALGLGQAAAIEALADANIALNTIASAIKSAYGTSAAVAEIFVKTLVQSGKDAAAVLKAARQAFGSTVTGQRVAAWLKEVRSSTEAGSDPSMRVRSAAQSAPD